MNKEPILKNHQQFLNYFWKSFVLLLIVIFIYQQDWSSLEVDFVNPLIPALVIVMMAFNWGLEAKKWQLLVGEGTFLEALKSVLVGLLFRQFISAVGDASGRLAGISGNRSTQLSSFFINAVCQNLITVSMGMIGAFTLLENQTIIKWGESVYVYLMGAALIFLLLIVILFLRQKISRFLGQGILILKNHSWQQIAPTLLYSLLRYAVFFTQFFMVFKMLVPDLDPWILMNGIAFIFLMKSIVPTINLFGDIGIREFSAIVFFGQFGVSTPLVVSATLVLWIINIFIPAISAIVFIPKLKLVHH